MVCDCSGVEGDVTNELHLSFRNTVDAADGNHAAVEAHTYLASLPSLTLSHLNPEMVAQLQGRKYRPVGMIFLRFGGAKHRENLAAG
jgi:hypothetical protein